MATDDVRELTNVGLSPKAAIAIRNEIAQQVAAGPGGGGGPISPLTADLDADGFRIFGVPNEPDGGTDAVNLNKLQAWVDGATAIPATSGTPADPPALGAPPFARDGDSLYFFADGWHGPFTLGGSIDPTVSQAEASPEAGNPLRGMFAGGDMTGVTFAAQYALYGSGDQLMTWQCQYTIDGTATFEDTLDWTVEPNIFANGDKDITSVTGFPFVHGYAILTTDDGTMYRANLLWNVPDSKIQLVGDVKAIESGNQVWNLAAFAGGTGDDRPVSVFLSLIVPTDND